MNALGGLRPALSGRETAAGQLARTYVELGDRELGALGAESLSPYLAARRAAVTDRADDAEWERLADARARLSHLALCSDFRCVTCLDMIAGVIVAPDDYEGDGLTLIAGVLYDDATGYEADDDDAERCDHERGWWPCGADPARCNEGDDVPHADYPHEAGRLYDCPACESQCHCVAGYAECVFDGPHNGLAAPALKVCTAPECPNTLLATDPADRCKWHPATADWFGTARALADRARTELAQADAPGCCELGVAVCPQHGEDSECECVPGEVCAACAARGYRNGLAGYAARIYPDRVTDDDIETDRRSLADFGDDFGCCDE